MSEPGTSAEDDRLVSAYLKGEAAAFEALYERYRNRVYGYVLKSTGERFVEEIYQDVWVKALVGLPRYKANGRFRSWLFSCAHNVIVDHYRKWSKENVEEHTEGVGAVKVNHESSEMRQKIEQALMSLPTEQRQAFYLREELSCSVKEIAEIQLCGLEAAKSRLRYAYAKLREELKDLRT